MPIWEIFGIPADTLSNLTLFSPMSISGQIDWHAWLTFRDSANTCPRIPVCWFLRQHIFWHAQWDTKSFNMVELTDKSAVSEENQIPVPEDKLKEEQKKEYEELVERFKRECLKSYSVNRSGEVIKKFNLPSFQPLTEAQRESKMIDAVGQAVAQAFIKSATVMGNTVHNAVVKTFAEGTLPGCMGPCYIQPDQMQYTPLEVSMAAALSAQDSQAGTSNCQTPP